MDKSKIIYRKAVKMDVPFMSKILVLAAEASGVIISLEQLAHFPDTYQYIEGFPNPKDTGIIAETLDGIPIACVWVRLLRGDEHAVKHHLPELTIGVLPEYRRKGIAEDLMKLLYKETFRNGIKEISLGVHKDNTAAIKLYQKQNWRIDGYYKDYIMMSRFTEMIN